MKTITGYSDKSFWIDDVEYQANEEQKTLLAALINFNTNPPEEENIHALWHSCPRYNGEGGYDFAERIVDWAEDKPEVKMFRFDDCMFMSSVGFIIPASSKYEHMGFNVVICPQAGKPSNFFLYPHHANSLLKALTNAMDEAKDMPHINPDKPSNKAKEQIERQILDLIEEPQS